MPLEIKITLTDIRSHFREWITILISKTYIFIVEQNVVVFCSFRKRAKLSLNSDLGKIIKKD